MMNFPHQPEHLTAGWLTDTLRQAGALHEAQVTSFEVKPISETAGLLGQNAIIRLAYDSPEDTAPPSLFAKFALADAGQRAYWRTSYVQEVLFYQRFAQRVALPTPRAYFSEFDETTGYFLLLLEDCSYGEVGERITGCSLARAKLVVSEIAQFHATWWNHPDVPRDGGKYTAEAITNWQAMYNHEANRVDEIPEIPRDPELVRTIQELSSHFVGSMAYQKESPYTLIHHDYHLRNLIFVEATASTKVLVLDWQDMSIGHGPTDVALFLGTSFSIDDRRTHELDLLKLYHDTLHIHGVTDYTFEQCWDDYRLGMFETLWREVGLFGLCWLQGDTYIEHRDVFGPRIFAAVVDLKSREVLSRLGS
ncbi:MAG: DUF1679 domain-containing protein [Caldilinea sp. CFX5]|nr:DUF1679 domain-containing protein [Caldilinea sp. CFX5]